jgi:HSP20 family molecular chaperone IbpA
MKHPLNHRRARLLAVCLASSGILCGPIRGASITEEKKGSEGFVQQMKEWREKMSDAFRDTWAGWKGVKSDQSIGAASIDLREQHDSYMVRLNLPNRKLDTVDIKLDGGSLHIIAPAEKDAGRYEQVLKLSNVKPQAVLQIERKPKDNLIVVTIPKTSAVAEVKPPLAPKPAPDVAPLDRWESDVFARMEKMRREMDRIFEDAFKDISPTLSLEPSSFFDSPRFGSSLDVQEEGGSYVVRAYLPDRNMDNVNVAVEGQTLRIEAKAEVTAKKEDQKSLKTHRTQYAQVITLPGPVKGDQMKVDKKEGMVVVTLPKA